MQPRISNNTWGVLKGVHFSRRKVSEFSQRKGNKKIKLKRGIGPAMYEYTEVSQPQ